MPYVYSTLTAPVEYATWTKGGGDMPTIESVVRIAGGTGVVDRKTLVTPEGAIVTKVTEKELTNLRDNEVFKLHEKNGFIVVKDHAEDGVAAASDMETRDQSAPLVPEDFAGTETGAPVLTEKEVSGASSKPNPRKV